jgi:3-methyladenine DNA glycosylase/8-oxoguanine DNA glycosylase
MAFTETFALEPLAPFSLDLSAKVFLNGDRHVRTYDNGEFCQVFLVDESLVFTKVVSIGTVEQPKLSVELKSNKPITAKIKQETLQAIAYIFSLNFDLSLFYKEVENDPVMHEITKQL